MILLHDTTMLINRWLWLVVIITLLSGCSTNTWQPSPTPRPSACRNPEKNGTPPVIGRLRVDGANVFCNGNVSRDGDEVYNGDTVTTGQHSSAIVDFIKGGYIQLDENTDPRLLQEALCIVVEMVEGQTFIDAKDVCIRTKNLDGDAGSKVNLLVKPQQSVLTVVRGKVHVISPVSLEVKAQEQISVSPRGLEYGPRRLTYGELSQVTKWRDNYFRRSNIPYGNRNASPDPNIGGCCLSPGQVARMEQQQCFASHGRFYPSEQRARAACLPPPRVGGCCLSPGQVARMEQQQCFASHGRFYPSEQSARAACLPPPRVGGCCLSPGQVARMEQQQCFASHGRFYPSEQRARAACLPPPRRSPSRVR